MGQLVGHWGERVAMMFAFFYGVGYVDVAFLELVRETILLSILPGW